MSVSNVNTNATVSANIQAAKDSNDNQDFNGQFMNVLGLIVTQLTHQQQNEMYAKLLDKKHEIMAEIAKIHNSPKFQAELNKLDKMLDDINKEIDSLKNEKQNKINLNTAQQIDSDFMLQLVSQFNNKSKV